MNYNSLKATINANIKQNGNQEITGVVLNSVLNAMVNALASAGATFGGIIDPTSSAPVSLDQATIYLALTPGEYTNFVDEDSEPIVVDGIALIQYDGGDTLEFSKIELKPWQMTIIPDVGNDYIGIFIPNGGCTLAVDSVGFHGLLCITNAYGISSATFVGSGGINTSVNVESGRMNTTPIVVLKSNNDAPITITCVAGNAPDGATATDEIIITPIATKAWTELGAGGGSDVFWATYGTTTYAEVIAAAASGKLVCTYYNKETYVCSFVNTAAGSTNNIFFTCVYDGYLKSIYIDVNNTWGGPMGAKSEYSSNKVSTISGNETNTTKYPNTKAVADALGKWGVISQTQTWTQDADGGYDYTMSGQVYGIIPQANIDLFVAAGAEFDTVTGYFKLNGLTDISYEEMKRIYEHGKAIFPLRRYAYYQAPIRTTLPFISPLAYNFANAVGCGGLFFYNKQIEVIRLTDESSYNNSANIPAASDLGSAFYIAQHLRDASYWSCSGNLGAAFDACVSLERIFIRGLNQSLSLKNSARLSEESLLYIINNAGANTITITLHASVYAKCQSGGEWYSDISTALSAHTNVSLASA